MLALQGMKCGLSSPTTGKTASKTNSVIYALHSRDCSHKHTTAQPATSTGLDWQMSHCSKQKSAYACLSVVFWAFWALNICVSMFVNVQYAHCAVSFFSFCLSFITTYSPKLQLTPEAISVYLDSMSAFHTGIIRAI